MRIIQTAEVPEPPQLTPAVFQQIEKEMQVWAQEFKRTKAMEVLTAEDLSVLVT